MISFSRELTKYYLIFYSKYLVCSSLRLIWTCNLGLWNSNTQKLLIYVKLKKRLLVILPKAGWINYCTKYRQAARILAGLYYFKTLKNVKNLLLPKQLSVIEILLDYLQRFDLGRIMELLFLLSLFRLYFWPKLGHVFLKICTLFRAFGFLLFFLKL